MNVKRLLAATGLVCLCLASSMVAQEKRSLAIPIAAAGGKTAECVLSCGPSVPTVAVAFSPDAKSLATSGYREVLLWDLAEAKLAKRIGADTLQDVVHALTFSADGGTLIVADGTPAGSGAVRLFNVADGQLAASLEQPQGAVYALALSPDGTLLAAGGIEPVVHVWKMDDKTPVASLAGHGGCIQGISFSSDGKLLITAAADGSARAWDTATWTTTRTVKQSEALFGAAFSADAATLAVAVGGPTDRSIRLIRMSDGRVTRTISTGAAMPLDMTWVTQGNRIYVPCSDGTVKAYNAGNGRLERTYSGHADWVYCLALTADATKLAAGCADGTVKLFNVADGAVLATIVQLTPRTDEWLMITPQGYLSTSVADAIQWTTTNITTAPAELTNLLRKPEFVQQVIAGNKVDPPVLE